LLIERGVRGQWTADEVHAYKKDIYRLLAHLGLINSEKVSENKSQQEITKVFYPEASADGLWYPAVSAGDMIKKGDFLGKVCDFFGNEPESFVSEADGVVLYLASTLSIRKKDPAVAYGEISK